jgi:hypothetical protein
VVLELNVSPGATCALISSRFVPPGCPGSRAFGLRPAGRQLPPAGRRTRAVREEASGVGRGPLRNHRRVPGGGLPHRGLQRSGHLLPR